jgi:Lar family restriction alleviation protein
MSELKPCPFCGSESAEAERAFGFYWIGCHNCGAKGGSDLLKEKAIEAWNRRADDIDIPIYDKETRHENCTVQILENTETGRISVGWWRNE